jgi:beta-lactam-binding protein with PASTA domain
MLLRWLTRPLVPALLAWLFVCLVLFLALDHFIMPWVAGKFASTVEVPKLLGMRFEKARELLVPNGLSLMLDSSTDFSDVPPGRIMSQFPDPGSTVKKGRRVWVRISKGRRGIEVPALRGMSLREAEISLQNAGLQLGGENYVSNSDIPAGAVIGSSPGARTIVEKGHVVNLDVSGTAPATDSAGSPVGALGEGRQVAPDSSR